MDISTNKANSILPDTPAYLPSYRYFAATLVGEYEGLLPILFLREIGDVECKR